MSLQKFAFNYNSEGRGFTVDIPLFDAGQDSDITFTIFDSDTERRETAVSECQVLGSLLRTKIHSDTDVSDGNTSNLYFKSAPEIALVITKTLARQGLICAGADVELEAAFLKNSIGLKD